MKKNIYRILTFYFVILLSLFFFIPKSVLATEYYIAGDTGNDTTGNGSSGTPWKTIQKAAGTALAPGDIVNVKGGITYNGANSCNSTTATVCLTKSGSSGNYITFQPWTGTGTPTINGPLAGRGFSTNNTTTGINYNKITGFIIINTSRGVVLGGNGNLVSNNVIYDESPSASSYGIYIFGSNYTSEQKVFNNTIYQKGTGIYIYRQGTATIKNNSILNSITFGLNVDNYYNVSAPTIDYNNIYGSVSKNYATHLLSLGIHNLSVNPQFANQLTYDFHLNSTSPIIDAGVTLSEVATDAEGINKPRGNAYDIGAYESSYTNLLIPSAIPTYTTPTNSMTQLAIFTGEGTGTHFANSLGYKYPLVVGDINEDGYDDIITSARKYNTADGRVYAFLGKSILSDSGAGAADIILSHTGGNANFGTNLSLGDIDNDEHFELIVTDPLYSTIAYQAGSAAMFRTGPSFASRTYSSADFRINGVNVSSRTSGPTTVIGDVNGDGYDDVLYDGFYDNKIYLFYGSVSLETKTVLQADVVLNFADDVDCMSSDKHYLSNVDLNGDHYDDIVFSCNYGKQVGNTYGMVYVFFGQATLSNRTSGQADVAISPNRSDGVHSQFAYDIASGDLNADGKSDLIIEQHYPGKIYVYWGTNNWSSMDSSAANLVLTGESVTYPERTDMFDAGLLMTDVNNDGIQDLVTSDVYMSRTLVFYGSVGFSKTNYSLFDLVFDTTWGDSNGMGLVDGDLNNDGYRDIILSAHNYNNFQGAIYVVTSPHGTPSIALNNIGNTNNLTISGSVTDTLTVGGVESSTDNGAWNTCTVSSGNFSCNLSSTLTDGSHSLRLRSKNSFGVYMATREYTTANFTYDKTSPLVDWTDTSGNKKKYESTGNDNVFTIDTLPTFTFTKSSDTTAGLSKYQILVNDNLYIDSIDPTKSEDKDYREDDDKYIKYEGDNNISVHTKKDKDKLLSGKAYKWKVRVVDSAGNSTDTAEKILRINTHEANFSGTWFPLSILNIGGIDTNITTLDYDTVPSSLNIYNTSPTFYGIAPVGTKVTLKIEKENDSNTGRDLVFSTTSSANESSRFGINIMDKLESREYFINLSSVNPQGDYVELPEFKLNIGRTGILKKIDKILKPNNIIPTSKFIKQKQVNIPNKPLVKQKRCFLFICW